MERGKWYVVVKDRETSVDRAIYRPAYETALAVLPRVRDEELIREAKRILEKEGMLSEEERGRIEDLEKKLEILMKGGFVGVPKTRADMLS